MAKKQANILSILRFIKKDWKMMSVFIFSFAVLGVIVAFSIPRIYKSKVMLAPESSSGSGLTSNISSLASMVGMDIKLGDESDAIYPEIYPDLMQSMDFLFSLFPIQVTTLDGKVKTTYYDYLLKHQKIEWWTYPIEWIKKKVASKKKGGRSAGSSFQPTRQQYDIAKTIAKSIDCQVDKKTSVISIEVTSQDPLVSAELADSVKEKLKAFITDYRTKKARKDVEYMKKLFVEAKADYTKARQKYAAYSDANEDLMLESYKAKQEDLENEMQLKYNIYTQIVQQLQLSKAKVQEKTPVFTVLQSASVPIKHSNKPKILILIQFMLIGFILRLCVLAVKNKDKITKALENEDNQE